MRILFASGSWSGGARRSAEQLAAALRDRGHEVWLVVGQPRSRPVGQLHRRLVNLAARDDGRMAQLAARVHPRLGRTLRHEEGPVPTWRALAPENALPDLVARLRPDVVVVSGLNRQPWRTIRRHLERLRVPSVLYLREHAALTNLRGPLAAPPDLLLANTRSFADEAAALGHRCEWVPSVVELDHSRVESTRRAALLVNPIESHGVDVGLALAAARPDIPVVLQESWPLDRRARARLAVSARALPNVEVRPRTDRPADVFVDARLLLVPHRLDNRPRVIAEALDNGIPAVVSSWPGLVDAAGPGGVVVDRDAPTEVWIQTVAELWDDDAAIDALRDAGRGWARREEADPDEVVRRFEELLRPLVERTA